jgi:two-component system, NarL family, nitrate/nitrite response regulator NarL
MVKEIELMRLRCLIVDDNARFREEACRLLEEQGVEIVGAAASGAEAVQYVGRLTPDVALVDIDLGGESGLDLARRLRDGSARPPSIVLISTHDESDYADLIAASPAVGFLSKSDLSAGAIFHVLAWDNGAGTDG